MSTQQDLALTLSGDEEYNLDNVCFENSKRRIAYVRLFAVRHTDSPCRRRRGLGGPSIPHRIERPNVPRIPKAKRTSEGFSRNVHPAVGVYQPARRMRGMHSRWRKARSPWNFTKPSTSLWFESQRVSHLSSTFDG